MAANDQQAECWHLVSQTPYPDGALPDEDPGLEMTKLLCPAYLKPSMTHTSDDFPEGRVKLIHPYGSVAKVKFQITSPGRCTGIFQNGGIGLARLSLARQHIPSFTPGMAVKVFVDKHPSLNFHVMNSLEGQGPDRNWFSRPFSNLLSLPTSLPQKVLWATFGMAVRSVAKLPCDRPASQGTLPLYQAASITSDGQRVPQPVTPFQVYFEPTKDITAFYEPLKDRDVRLALADIKPGTALYNIRLRDAEGQELGPAVGQLVTDSAFVASEYGDRHLFFQHMQHRQPGAA